MGEIPTILKPPSAESVISLDAVQNAIDERSRQVNLYLHQLALEYKRARRKLIDFFKAAWLVLEPQNPLELNWHHYFLAEVLEGITNGQLQKVLINLEYGTTKTSLATIAWPAWSWIEHPELRFMTGSHTDDMSRHQSDKSRTLIKSSWYQDGFGDSFALRSSNDAKSFYENDRFGWRSSFGLNGSITGWHADVILIDDPHDAQKAESTKMRQSAVNKFFSTLLSRTNSPTKSAYVVIGQRVHRNDLSGEIIDRSSGWTQVILPHEFDPDRRAIIHCLGIQDARTQRGEKLWPLRHGDDWSKEQMENLGTRGYAAQLNQNPAGDEGAILQLKWYPRYPAALSRDNYTAIIQSWDTAVTNKDTSAGWACITWGLTSLCKLHILDLTWRRMIYPEGLRMVGAQFMKWRPNVVVVENASSGQELLQESFYDNEGNPLIIPFCPYQPITDKPTRAEWESPIIQRGDVFLPENAEWLGDYEQAIIEFPDGRKKDIIDSQTVGLAFFREGGYTQVGHAKGPAMYRLRRRR